MSNRSVSELHFLKNRILSGEFANGCWDAKFGEAWQDDLEWHGWLCRHSLRHESPLIWTIELRANFIRFLLARTRILSSPIANAAEFNLI
jgi:hypothetical protein